MEKYWKKIIEVLKESWDETPAGAGPELIFILILAGFFILLK